MENVEAWVALRNVVGQFLYTSYLQKVPNTLFFFSFPELIMNLVVFLPACIITVRVFFAHVQICHCGCLSNCLFLGYQGCQSITLTQNRIESTWTSSQKVSLCLNHEWSLTGDLPTPPLPPTPPPPPPTAGTGTLKTCQRILRDY